MNGLLKACKVLQLKKIKIKSDLLMSFTNQITSSFYNQTSYNWSRPKQTVQRIFEV
jgi:hypothetical protein